MARRLDARKVLDQARQLTHEQALTKLKQAMYRLPRHEGLAVARAALDDPQIVTDLLNTEFKDRAMTDDDVLEALRRIPQRARQMKAAGRS